MIKVEFNCNRCGKGKLMNIGDMDILSFTSCDCGTYFSILNTLSRVRVEEIEKQEFYDMYNVIAGNSDEND